MPQLNARPGRWAVPAVILLICAVLAVAAQSAPKSVVRGIIRYERRGVSAAPPIGFATGVMMGGAAAVGQQRVLKGVLSMLTGAATLSGNASLKESSDFLRSMDNLDMSGLPVRAEYGAEAFFTLTGDENGVFNLADGTVSWSTRNNTRLEFSGEQGNTHIFHDKASGQGSGRLTPENSSITIRTEGKGKSATFDLAVSVGHEMPYDGSALWSAMSGLMVIEARERAGKLSWNANILGMPYTEEDPGPANPAYGGFTYFRYGPLDSLAGGSEVWLNWMDNPERLEYELFLDCTAEIQRPVENDELVFDQKRPARIENHTKARVKPELWSPAVRWILPEIDDSKIEPAPDDALGDSLPYTYTGLPEKNSSFKFGDFKTDMDSPKARSAGCQGETRPVAFFFSREAANNPGKPAVPGGAQRSGPDPNWFYYWKQTKAAQGHADQIRFGGGTDRCEGAGDYGNYRFENTYIVVCDLAASGFASRSYPGIGSYNEYHGIDVFATTVRHEWQHYLNYQEWWAPKGYYKEALDKDADRIPDELEPKLTPPAPLNKTTPHFDPNVMDSALRGLGDEHTIAWAAEAGWAEGSADTEDWSCPGGHQAFSDECAEIYQVVFGK